MKKAYSLDVFNSVIASSPGFVARLGERETGWKRSKRDQGGDWTGSCELHGPEAWLVEVFQNWLGYDLRERTGGYNSWRGMIYEIDLVQGGVRRRRSLDRLANRVRTSYLDPNREVQTSSWATNATSITRYGQRDEQLVLDQLPQPAAEALRDRTLLEYSWPRPSPVAVTAPEDTYVELYACGYSFTMNWRFITQTSEYDYEQEFPIALRYDDITGNVVLTDEKQDWTDWETTSGDAVYSVWTKASDNTYYWAYCGAAATNVNPNDSVYVYTDQAMTTRGWNGGDPSALDCSSYYVRGPASRWVSEIVTTDCQFVTAGNIETNLVQVSRMMAMAARGWDTIQDLVSLGDVDGQPWRCWVDRDLRVHYGAIATAPLYYLRKDGLYDRAGGKLAVNPWMMQPGVIRDMASLRISADYAGWLEQARDIYVEEVEVSADGALVLKTANFDEGDLLTGMQTYLHGLKGPEKRTMRRSMFQGWTGPAGHPTAGHPGSTVGPSDVPGEEDYEWPHRNTKYTKKQWKKNRRRWRA